MHDSKMQRQSITLAFSVATLMSAIVLFIFKLNVDTLIAVAILFILAVIFFPRIYWKVIFKRIDNTVYGANINYDEMVVSFGDVIEVTIKQKVYLIKYSDIIGVDYTKNTCLIFYVENEKNNTLIIPNEVLGDDIRGVYELIAKMKEQYE